jgi:hypothetical protein
MDKTKNIYTLIILALVVAVLFGTFFLVYNIGSVRTENQTERIAIERLREINEGYYQEMQQNTQVVLQTKAAIDSFIVYDKQREEQEFLRIKNSRTFVSQIPHLSNDSLQKTYNNSWTYLLNEYRSGRLQPSE